MENKIEIFDKETTWNRRGKPPVVNICTSGHIRFSVTAVKLLGLKKGETINFRTHSNDTGIIYFYKDAKGFPLRVGAEVMSGVRLEIYCRPLSLKLLKFFDFVKTKSFGLSNNQIDYEGQKFWFIKKDDIHKPLKWKKRDSNCQ